MAHIFEKLIAVEPPDAGLPWILSDAERWTSQRLRIFRERVEAILGKPIDAIYIAPQTSELGKPSVPIAAVFTLPLSIRKPAGFKTVLILPHKPFNSKKLDHAFVWAVRTREELTRFCKEFPGASTFVFCHRLGIALSPGSRPYADIIWALLELENLLGYEKNYPCFRISFSDLPRGVVTLTGESCRIVFVSLLHRCWTDTARHFRRIVRAILAWRALGISGEVSVAPPSIGRSKI